jgi:hypothetical protein
MRVPHNHASRMQLVNAPGPSKGKTTRRSKKKRGSHQGIIDRRLLQQNRPKAVIGRRPSMQKTLTQAGNVTPICFFKNLTRPLAIGRLLGERFWVPFAAVSTKEITTINVNRCRELGRRIRN